MKLARHQPFDGERLGALFDSAGEMRLAAGEAHWPFDQSEWREWISAPGVNAWFVVLGDRTIGHFALRQFREESRHLSWLYLMPKARGGQGRALVALIERAAQDLGASFLTLNVNHTNPRAQHLYRACGFNAVEHLPDKIFMRKELS